MSKINELLLEKKTTQEKELLICKKFILSITNGFSLNYNLYTTSIFFQSTNNQFFNVSIFLGTIEGKKTFSKLDIKIKNNKMSFNINIENINENILFLSTSTNLFNAIIDNFNLSFFKSKKHQAEDKLQTIKKKINEIDIKIHRLKEFQYNKKHIALTQIFETTTNNEFCSFIDDIIQKLDVEYTTHYITIQRSYSDFIIKKNNLTINKNKKVSIFLNNKGISKSKLINEDFKPIKLKGEIMTDFNILLELPNIEQNKISSGIRVSVNDFYSFFKPQITAISF